MVTINHALELINQLDFTTREMLLDIFQKRQIEERRKEIFRNAKFAKDVFRKGLMKSLPAHQVIEILNAFDE